MSVKDSDTQSAHLWSSVDSETNMKMMVEKQPRLPMSVPRSQKTCVVAKSECDRCSLQTAGRWVFSHRHSLTQPCDLQLVKKEEEKEPKLYVASDIWHF